MTDHDKNWGCGPGFIEDYAPDWVMECYLDVYFKKECLAHDEGYINGGTAWDRYLVDREFRSTMMTASTNFRMRMVARLYYRLVRVFGWMAWGTSK